jgi:serine/threonine protein kinase
MPVERFLSIAERVAAAVAEIHAAGVTHKNLNPENIFVAPSTGHVRITNFGIATRLPREYIGPRSARLIEGSLPYISPEQTGRTSRPIDSRSDLYSLGVTFYRMLTGRLPFDADDPLGWVHCHIARRPLPPTDHVPSLPVTVVNIVLELLAKLPKSDTRPLPRSNTISNAA